MKTGTCIRKLAAHSDPVTSVHFDRDGSNLVSASYDGLVRIWDPLDGSLKSTLVWGDGQEHAPVSFARWSSNGKFLLIGTLDGKIRLWHVKDCKAKKEYKGRQCSRYCLNAVFCLHNNGMSIVGGSEDHRILVWDLQQRKVKAEIPGRAGPNGAAILHVIVLSVRCTHHWRVFKDSCRTSSE